MNFVDELCDNAKIVFDKTEEKAEEIIDKGKAQVEIAKIRRKLRRSYAKLGVAVYSKEKADKTNDQSIRARILEIDILRERLADLINQCDIIKYSKKCKNCGAYNDKEDEVCLNCGANLYPYHKTVYSVRFPGEE